MSSETNVDTADVSMITLQQANIANRKRSQIDFTKSTFTEEECLMIRKEVDVIKEKYPSYIPIIVKTRDTTIQLTKRKFLVGGDITIGQFMSILRKKMSTLKSTEAVFLLINNTMPPASAFLSAIYATEKDIQTDMLFVTVCKENTFG